MSQVLPAQDGNRFGTFTGVFTPCVLTILGVIMFLRFDVVVGNAGVLAALGIVFASNSITILTTLSLSAIATNTKVEGGGVYFLISRSLGPKFGGAIGLLFFAAQALSVALYVIGFTIALKQYLPPSVSPLLISTITNVMVFGCVAIGAGWTLRIQFFILATVAVSLLSFFVGAWSAFDPELLSSNLTSAYSGDESFWTMFALFFPAVTGIMAGANMSGELRDPARSIPRGTLAAVFVTALIYAAQAVFLGGSVSRNDLVHTEMVMAEIAILPVFIAAGVIAATMSSALGSMMGAPRILQSMARDRVLPRLEQLGVRSGKNQEPRRAIFVTFLISQAGIMAADLNTIAPLITMAFLVTYGLLNLATFYETITKNPSYRPRFRFCHWTTSLTGAVGCGAMMVLIDWGWALLALLLVGVLYWYLSRKAPINQWGDLQSGYWFERTRQNLIKLENELYHPKNWRPFVLALSGQGFTRPHLVVFGAWLTSETGVLTLGQVISGNLDDRLERSLSQEKILRSMIRERQLAAFPSVVVAADYVAGIEALVQCQGLGSLRPNVVLLGCPLTVERMGVFGNLLRNLQSLGRSAVVLRRTDEPSDDWAAPAGPIDVWWRGRANGELMILLSHLILQHPLWQGRRLRLLRVVESEAGTEEVRSHLDRLLREARIQATTKVVVASDAAAAIQTTSRDAAFVFLGIQPPEVGCENEFFSRIELLVGRLQRVAFVQSAGGVRLES